MVKKICVVCGKEFLAETNKAKYCSKHCANRSRYARSHEDLLSEREKIHRKAIELFDSEYSTKEIANILGVSLSCLYAIWKKAGFCRRLTPLQKEVKQLRLAGKCASEIADELGKPTKTITLAATAIGMPFNPDEIKRSVERGHNKLKQFYKKSEKENKEYVESFLEKGFSYVSGYTHSDSTVLIKCDKCGKVFERSMITIRHKKHIACPSCLEKDREIKERERSEERERCIAERKAKQEKRKREKELERIARTRIVVCVECGKVFKTTNKTKKCCSPECSKKRQNRRKDRRISKEKYIDSDINTKTLYKRDNGVCWICGGKCDFDDYVVKDGVIICGGNYPSVDHVVEICNGGTHSWDNVRLAHRSCNTARYYKNNAS